jgi:RNA polymerase sigma-70 factor (ECF subfamily)
VPGQKGLAADMKKFPESDYYSIIEQYHDVVRRFISMTVKNQWVSDDLTQETFIKAYKSIDSLEDVSKIKSWLIRIAYNLCLDHFRTASKNKIDSLDSIEEVFSSNILPMGKQLERNEMSQCVQEKMLLLPQSYRSILCLSDIAGLTHNEIAEMLEVNVGNVKVRLHRARTKMKEILNKHCDFGNDERAVLVCTPKQKIS